MTRRRIQCGMFFAVVCSAVVVFADAGTAYTIDPTRSEFAVQLFKAGAGALFAHDHVVRATMYTGQIHFDRDTPANSSVSIEVQSASLKIDEAEVRKKYDLPSQLSEKDRLQIQETMLSPSQLDAAHYPIIQFSSTQIVAQTDEIYTVTGDLTIRKITRTVIFSARIEHDQQTLHVHGSFRFKQSSFGYEPYSALFGAVRNQDEVLLHFDLVASPAKGE